MSKRNSRPALSNSCKRFNWVALFPDVTFSEQTSSATTPQKICFVLALFFCVMRRLIFIARGYSEPATAKRAVYFLFNISDCGFDWPNLMIYQYFYLYTLNSTSGECKSTKLPETITVFIKHYTLIRARKCRHQNARREATLAQLAAIIETFLWPDRTQWLQC